MAQSQRGKRMTAKEKKEAQERAFQMELDQKRRQLAMKVQKTLFVEIKKMMDQADSSVLHQ